MSNETSTRVRAQGQLRASGALSQSGVPRFCRVACPDVDSRAPLQQAGVDSDLEPHAVEDISLDVDPFGHFDESKSFIGEAKDRALRDIEDLLPFISRTLAAERDVADLGHELRYR